MERMALDGIRIIEVSNFLALPYGTMLLADMGAEVIRVESLNRPRYNPDGPFPDNEPGEKHWNQGGNYHLFYRNKMSLPLDLAKPQGVDIFRRLVKVSDVVAENLRPGVMKRLGLDYDVLKQIRSDIIMLTNSGYGHSGPWTNYGAFARTIDAMAGLSYLTGYQNGPPLRANPSYMDMTAGWNNAIAILMALHYRRRTGKGQWIDHAMYQGGISTIAEALMDYQMNARTGTRLGNRHPMMAPHGCYRCRGDEKWVVIAVASDDEWQSLCRAMDEPEWAKEDRFAQAPDRWCNQDELDRLIQEWTLSREHYEVMNRMQGFGVAAGAVLNSKELLMNPHLKQRGFFESFTHPPQMERVGTRLYPGRAFRLSKTTGNIRYTSAMGAYNEHILSRILGMSAGQVAQLHSEGIIGTELVGPSAARPPVMPLPLAKELGLIHQFDSDYKKILGIDR